MSNLEPRFLEECPKCKFIGQLGRYDIYVHEDGPQIVARFGEDGDYLSTSLSSLHLFDLKIEIRHYVDLYDKQD